MHPHRSRAIASACSLLVASASTFAALLLAARPNLDPSVLTSNGNDLALVVAWVGAVACTLWLALTTLACLVALVHGRRGLATRIAGFGPPLARRLLQTALVGTFAVMPTAANATPTAPLVLHVGSGGRLANVPGDPTNDTPVVRTPPPSSAPTRPAPSATVPTTALAPIATTTGGPAVALPVPTPLPAVRGPAAVATIPPDATAHLGVSRHVAVRGGDNLWSIAAAETARVSGVAHPDTRVVARYWVRVVAANRSTLRSGNPSLIFPGELIRLPDLAR